MADVCQPKKSDNIDILDIIVTLQFILYLLKMSNT